MLRAYRTPEKSDAVIALAEKLVAVILRETATYQESVDALDTAGELLLTKCWPVNEKPHQHGS